MDFGYGNVVDAFHADSDLKRVKTVSFEDRIPNCFQNLIKYNLILNNDKNYLLEVTLT